MRLGAFEGLQPGQATLVDELIGLIVLPRSRDARRDACSRFGQHRENTSALARVAERSGSKPSYNPILDLNGKQFKVVKYATDITVQALTRVRAERARSLIESVAAGSEEMNASIREIAETMVKSRQTAGEAVLQVDSAGLQAQRLATAARSMEGIVGLIADITGQINLLALNATIESARAGDAGARVCRRRSRSQESGDASQGGDA